MCKTPIDLDGRKTHQTYSFVGFSFVDLNVEHIDKLTHDAQVSLALSHNVNHGNSSNIADASGALQRVEDIFIR